MMFKCWTVLNQKLQYQNGNFAIDKRTKLKLILLHNKAFNVFRMQFCLLPTRYAITQTANK